MLLLLGKLHQTGLEMYQLIFVGPGITNTGTSLTAFSVFNMIDIGTYTVDRILSLAAPGNFDYNSALYCACIQRNSGNFNAYRNSTALSQATAIFGSPVLTCSLFDGTNHTIYLNGTGSTLLPSQEILDILAMILQSDFGEENLVYLNGTIGEVILYNTNLTIAQRRVGYIWPGNGVYKVYFLATIHTQLVPPLPF
jgi:hypothetical protein